VISREHRGSPPMDNCAEFPRRLCGGIKGYEFIANGLQVVVIVEGFPFLETGKEGLREYLREKNKKDAR